MYVALVCLYLLSMLLTFPLQRAASRILTEHVRTLTGFAIYRIALGYLVGLSYTVLMVVYLIHIHQGRLLLLFVLPMIISYLLNPMQSSQDKAAVRAEGGLKK